jgi:hypothetical protein
MNYITKMKNLFIIVTVMHCCIVGFSQQSQNELRAKVQIKAIVENFVKATETRDVFALDTLLNENFRVVANQFPTPDKITVLPKSAYLQLMKEGKLGGDNRTIRVLDVDILQHIAFMKVELKSGKTIFTSYMTFILNTSNRWQLINDMPFVEKIK